MTTETEDVKQLQNQLMLAQTQAETYLNRLSQLTQANINFEVALSLTQKENQRLTKEIEFMRSEFDKTQQSEDEAEKTGQPNVPGQNTPNTPPAKTGTDAGKNGANASKRK